MWLVYTTLDDRALAHTLAKRLVQEGLAACVQVSGPVMSYYHWDGQLNNTEEVVLTMKCSPGQWDRLKNQFTQLHPYDTPELIAVAVQDGLPGYLAWVQASDNGTGAPEVGAGK